jgi:hypothetical protein
VGILPRHLDGGHVEDMLYDEDRNSSFDNMMAVPEVDIHHICLDVFPLHHPYMGCLSVAWPSLLVPYQLSDRLSPIHLALKLLFQRRYCVQIMGMEYKTSLLICESRDP